MLTEDERRLLALKKLVDCYLEDAVEPKEAAFRCKLDGSLHSTAREAGEHVQATHGAQVEQLLRQLLDDMEQDHMGFFFTKMCFSEFLYPPVPPLVRQMASGYPSAPAPTFLPRTGARAQATAPAEKGRAGSHGTASFPVRFGLKPSSQVLAIPPAAASSKKKGKKAAGRAGAELQASTNNPFVSLAQFKQLVALDSRLHPRQCRERIAQWCTELEESENGKSTPSAATKAPKQASPRKSVKVAEAPKTQPTRPAGAAKGEVHLSVPSNGGDRPQEAEKEQRAKGHSKKEKSSPKKNVEDVASLQRAAMDEQQAARAGQKAERAALAQKQAAKEKRAMEVVEKKKKREVEKQRAAAAEKAAAVSKAEGDRLFKQYGEGLAEEMIHEVVDNLLSKLAKRSLQQILKQRAKEAQQEAEREQHRALQERKRLERKQRRDFRQQMAVELTDDLLDEVVKASCSKLAATMLEDLYHEAWLLEEQRRQESYRAAVAANARAREEASYAPANDYVAAHAPQPPQVPAMNTSVFRPPIPEAVEIPLGATDLRYPIRSQDCGPFFDSKSPSPFMLPAAAGAPRAWAPSPSAGVPSSSPAVAAVTAPGEPDMEIPDFLRDELQELLGETQAMRRGTGTRAEGPASLPKNSEGTAYFSSPFPYFGSPKNMSRFLDDSSSFSESAEEHVAGVELLHCIPEDFGMDSLRCVAVRRLPAYATADHLCRFFGVANVDVSLVEGIVVPKIRFLKGPDAGTCLVQLNSQAAMQEALQRNGALLGQAPIEVHVPLGKSAADVLPAYSAFPVGASPLDIGLGPSVTGIGAAVSSLPLPRPAPIRSPNRSVPTGRLDTSPGYTAAASPVLDGSQRYAVGSGSPSARRQRPPTIAAGTRRAVPTDRFGASVFTGDPSRPGAFPGGAYGTYGGRKLRGMGRARARYPGGAYYSPSMDPTPPPPPSSWAWPDDDELDDDYDRPGTQDNCSTTSQSSMQEKHQRQQYHM